MSKICTYCDNNLPNEAVVCPGCGRIVPAENSVARIERPVQHTKIDQTVNVGLVILAALFPLFGFIYWIAKRKNRPYCARACGITAAISLAVCLIIVFVVIPFLVHTLVAVIENHMHPFPPQLF